MNGELATLLPAAVGVAISPAPVVELILVLFSRRRGPNAIAFVVTLVVMTAAALLLGVAGEQAASGSGDGTSRGMALLLIGLGALLLVLGLLGSVATKVAVFRAGIATAGDPRAVPEAALR